MLSAGQSIFTIFLLQLPHSISTYLTVIPQIPFSFSYSQSQSKILPIPFPPHPLLLISPGNSSALSNINLPPPPHPAFPSLSTGVPFCIRKAEDLAGKAECCLVGKVARKLNGQIRNSLQLQKEGNENRNILTDHICPQVGSKHTKLFEMVRKSPTKFQSKNVWFWKQLVITYYYYI